MKTNYRLRHKKYFANKKHFAIFALFIVFLATLAVYTNLYSKLSIKIYSTFYIFTERVSSAIYDSVNFISPKYKLLRENQNLRSELQRLQTVKLYNEVLMRENEKLRELLGSNISTSENPFNKPSIPARITGYNSIPYGTILISSDSRKDIPHNAIVAFGNIALGSVIKSYGDTALVELFTAGGKVYDVFVRDKKAVFTGVSNGTGTISITKEMDIEIGDIVTLPIAHGYILGMVRHIEYSDEDSLQKLYVASPINIRDLMFVNVLIPNADVDDM